MQISQSRGGPLALLPLISSMLMIQTLNRMRLSFVFELVSGVNILSDAGRWVEVGQKEDFVTAEDKSDSKQYV